jgi:hypothetical protein
MRDKTIGEVATSLRRSTVMNTERLELVCKKLEEVTEEQFNYAVWVGHDWKGKEDLSCGTTACALGWAATVPELREAGLCLRRDDYGYGYVDLVSRDTKAALGWRRSLNAAMRVFDLTESEADYLFVPSDNYDANYSDYDKQGPTSDASAKEVAQHIKDFVERGGMP